MLLHKPFVGRFGNRLFEVAAMVGLANLFDHPYELPEWEPLKHFKTKFNTGDTHFFDRTVHENSFTYDE